MPKMVGLRRNVFRSSNTNSLKFHEAVCHCLWRSLWSLVSRFLVLVPLVFLPTSLVLLPAPSPFVLLAALVVLLALLLLPLLLLVVQAADGSQGDRVFGQGQLSLLHIPVFAANTP